MADTKAEFTAEQVSDWLRDARDAAKLTRRTVSDRLGVTEGAVQNWENAKKPALPPAAQFLQLVKLYRAEKRLLVLLGTWELRKGGEGGGGQRRKAGGE